MSNFQRTRSKVWWGGDLSDIGSPIPHSSNREPTNKQEVQVQSPEEADWEPQVPQWSPRKEETPSPPVNDVWARGHSSPTSHKSQDSGFSDSDSSPPTVLEQNPKKEAAELKCCAKTPPKEACPETPKTSRVFDTPVRSAIKTPKDMQNYLQAHCDIGHGSFDVLKCETENECAVEVFKTNGRQIIVTPHKNINNNNVILDIKCDAKKKLFGMCPDDARANMEYIRLSSSDQVAVNNRPRMRSPITGITSEEPFYFPARGDGNNLSSSGRFQRNTRLNKSLTYKTQRLDEQILDDGPHSLSWVDNVYPREYASSEVKKYEGQTAKALCTRKITDSLNLKTPKKSMSRTKQKIGSKTAKNKPTKSFFNFLPKKNDTFKTIYDITRGMDDDRVPTLGLPANHRSDDWVLVDSDEVEHEVDDYLKQSPIEVHPMVLSKSPKGILKAPGQNRSNGSLRSNLSVDDLQTIREMELNAFTSTPKLFPPKERNESGKKSTEKSASKLKPVNLMENFNKTISDTVDQFNFSKQKHQPQNNCVSQVEKVSRDQPPPVKFWLQELADSYESECMTTLQSKALGVEFNTKVASSSATITGNIRKVQTHGQIIAHQYKQTMKNLKKTSSYDITHCNSEIQMLTANINEFVLAHSITLKIKPPGETPERWDKIKSALENNIQRVIDVIEDVNVELNESYPELEVLYNHLRTLLDIFLETARAVLVQQMKTLVSMLEEPPSDMILKSILISLSHLGVLMSPDEELADDDIMNFVTKLPFIECGVPRALLGVIIESNKSSIKSLCLRTLATICTTNEGVEQFEEAGGLEILSEILGEESNPEPQIREAVTVLTQITGPWLHGYKLRGLDKYLDVYIKNITGILSSTACCQLLLLCTACLVNLINIVKQKDREQLNIKDDDVKSLDIVEIISRHKTVGSLLESVKKRGPSASIFLQEQTATFINVLSTSSRGQTLLAGCPATAVALVCFLRVPCASPARAARLQAEFRLINQSTEALARLCAMPEITIQVVQLEGVTRLVRVIEAQKSQKADVKCSDKILVNCLRALRAIAKNHGDCFKDIDTDVTNMIAPPLMESVRFYSARQESYV